jgi:hypothetical protein
VAKIFIIEESRESGKNAYQGEDELKRKRIKRIQGEKTIHP